MDNLPFASPKVLTLEGGHNFREVGGYPTGAGGQVRGGLVWRSAGLDRLSPSDCRDVLDLGIVTIVDLRTDIERERFPTAPGLARAATTLSWSSVSASWGRPDREAWAGMGVDGMRDQIARLYTGIAEAHLEHLGGFLGAVADGDLPVLVHCTAGKDRTGLAIALLLELLGVPREWVLWDYEQTRLHLKTERVHLEAAMGVGGQAEWLGSLDPESRALILGVDPAYLTAALKDLDQRFGGAEGFAHDRLGLSAERLERLRGRLLGEEPATRR